MELKTINKLANELNEEFMKINKKCILTSIKKLKQFNDLLKYVLFWVDYENENQFVVRYHLQVNRVYYNQYWYKTYYYFVYDFELLNYKYYIATDKTTAIRFIKSQDTELKHNKDLNKFEF